MVAWAVAGTAVAFGLLLIDVHVSGQGIVRLIRPGRVGPAVGVVRHDFPEAALPAGSGLDGQQFYAIARNPWHADEVAPHLGHPRYRYQRILLPALAWVLHPSGGGSGLLYALVAVNLAGLLVGALALGELSQQLGGPRWLAVLYPVLPGALLSLLVTVADGLAVALALVTVTAFLRGRNVLASAAAVGAVLARETTILVPLALLLARRRRSDAAVLVAPALAMAAWFLVVRVAVPAGGSLPEQLVAPLTGLVEAVRTRWLHGHELLGMAATVSALAAGGYVLARAKGPAELRWVAAVQVAFLLVCSSDVLGNDFGGTRSTLALLAVALPVLAAATPARAGSDLPRRA